jgi:hypothetical protein
MSAASFSIRASPQLRRSAPNRSSATVWKETITGLPAMIGA